MIAQELEVSLHMAFVEARRRSVDSDGTLSAEVEYRQVAKPSLLLQIAKDPLVAEVGASQVMIGTDYPFPWSTTTVNHVLNSKSLNDAQKRAILGETAARLLKIA